MVCDMCDEFWNHALNAVLHDALYAALYSVGRGG